MLVTHFSQSTAEALFVLVSGISVPKESTHQHRPRAHCCGAKEPSAVHEGAGSASFIPSTVPSIFSSKSRRYSHTVVEKGKIVVNTIPKLIYLLGNKFVVKLRNGF